MSLLVLAAGPGITVQDLGRPGFLAQGLSRGGAADPVALAEGAALLGQDAGLAAIELAGAPARFRLTAPARIALTGAPFRALLRDPAGETPLAWNASHALPAGGELALSPLAGGYGYLVPGGGVDAPLRLGARSAHLAAGIGAALAAGDNLALGPDPGTQAELLIAPLPRDSTAPIRVVASLQTALFPAAEIARFQRTAFRRDPRGNRMGLRLDQGDAPGFAPFGGLSVVSEIVQPGDIQITGDGTALVLLAECQTTGGYPRIATVLPCDLYRVAQAPPGAMLRFQLVGQDEARAAMHAHASALAGLRSRITPRLRDPATMADLLSYNLIGGVVSATAEGSER